MESKLARSFKQDRYWQAHDHYEPTSLCCNLLYKHVGFKGYVTASYQMRRERKKQITESYLLKKKKMMSQKNQGKYTKNVIQGSPVT